MTTETSQSVIAERPRFRVTRKALLLDAGVILGLAALVFYAESLKLMLFTYVNGFGATDAALLINRVLLGLFFVLARFRWIYDPSRLADHPWFNPARHEHLSWKLCSCGYARNVYLSGTVALIEIFAGASLIVGFLTTPAAAGLLGVLGFATWCTAKEKTMKQNPVDVIDDISCYMWTVEPLYIGMAVIALIAGAGAYSVDAWLLVR